MNLRAIIRKYCIYCLGGAWSEVSTCGVKKCPFYRFRMGKKIKFERKSSKIRELAIKQFCEECQGKVGKLTQEVRNAVINCTSKICPLIKYKPEYANLF